MKWKLPVLIAACLSVASGALAHPGHEPAGISEPGLGGAGHHAIGEIYDEERMIVLAGEVESFLFGNPHSVLHVRVVDDGGRARTWAVEWRAANRLSRAGLTGGRARAGGSGCAVRTSGAQSRRLSAVPAERGPARGGLRFA